MWKNFWQWGGVNGVPIFVYSSPFVEWYITIFLHNPWVYWCIQWFILLWNFSITYLSWETFRYLLVSSFSLTICVHLTTFLIHFELWTAYTLVLAWYLALMDYCLLQFHHAAFANRFVCCLHNLFGYSDWKCNWYYLWFLWWLPGSLWDHHLQIELFSQDTNDQAIALSQYWSLNLFQEWSWEYGGVCHSLS